MKIKLITLSSAFAAFFLATAGNLSAQAVSPGNNNDGHPGNPSNVGNYAGEYQTVLSQAVLVATTSDGQDVSNGLTVPVGQPIPTVTFSISGAGVNPPASWLVVLAPPTVASNTIVDLGVGNFVEMAAANNWGNAPGLGILASTPIYAFSNGPQGGGAPLEAEVAGAAVAQLGGTPTQTGVFDITIIAYQDLGLSGAATPNFDYIIHVTATSFTTQPANQSVVQGQGVTFTAVAAGSPTYQWSGPNGVIAGATGASLALTNVQPSAAGAYSVTATVAGGAVTSNSATLTVLPLAAPAITQNPTAVTVVSGRSAVFSAAASGEEPPTYQWSLNGVPLSGATDPVLEVAASSANAGAYTCTASNSSGTATSTAATLTVVTSSNPGYLTNLSARAYVGTGDDILIGGFGVGGTGAKQLLVRGTGPALAVFFNTELAAPQLVLLDNLGAIVSTNLGWGSAPVAGPSTAAESPAIAGLTLMNSLGAFSYAAGSADTATVITMPVGNNTAQISGVGGTSGIGLCEIYDADTGTPTARLINISARADVGTGNNILIGGFVIGGTAAETVLIRAVGPGLNDTYPSVFPLSSVLNQPVLTLLQGSTTLASNTVWGGDTTIARVANTIGAFPLNAAHADSVLLVTLPPGGYTAEVSGVNGGTGIALVEVYEVQ